MNANGSHDLDGNPDDRDAVHHVGESSTRTSMQAPNATVPGISPMAPARALLIYLKHRGVLNVEEFRRTNARRE